MAKSENSKKCFLIMPITTPDHLLDMYKDDDNHFSHVLDCLFTPALKNAGFEPVSPKSTGSDVIQADIIKQLSNCELVLCDMSILNPNVFFEFGIRTALNKPVALVIDDKTKNIPFDTSIINFHKYSSSLDAWSIETEINTLAEHVRNAYKKTKDYNALWKYFGVAQTGMFKPEEASLGEKIDLLMQEVAALKSGYKELRPLSIGESLFGKTYSYADLMAETEHLERRERERKRAAFAEAMRRRRKEIESKEEKDKTQEPDSSDKE